MVDKGAGCRYRKIMPPTDPIESHLARRNLRGLVNALRDRRVLIRRRAAQALGELADPAAVPALGRAARQDKDPYVQQWTIDALRRIGGEAAIDALVDVLFGRERQLTALAAQALASLPDARAQVALQVRDLLIRNDWAGLARLGEAAQPALSAVLNSDQYAAWPSGKRKEVLAVAARVGARPPARWRRELAGAGLFVSGLHTVGDLIGGLRHRNPGVREAAAEKLGASGIAWTSRPLYRRLLAELGAGGDRRVAATLVRAMAQLGDRRGLDLLSSRLTHPNGRIAAEAARLLAQTSLKAAFEALFWFVATPPPPPAYRNVPLVLSALELAGPATLDALRGLTEDERPAVRRLMVELIARCGHPDAADLLSRLAADADPEVQHAALDGLASLNSVEAATALYALSETAPKRWVIRALAAITDPAGPRLLRELDPQATTLQGTLRDGREPLQGARVQVVREVYGSEGGPTLQAVSARAETNSAGEFALTVYSLEAGAPLRLKVTTEAPPHRSGGTFLADLPLRANQENYVLAWIDRFFGRLGIEVGDEGGAVRANT